METLLHPRGLDNFISLATSGIGREAKTSSLTWNSQGKKHLTVNVIESRDPMGPLFVAPRSCVERRATVVNSMTDGKHSMTEKLG
jgi:hypothetical protein